MVSFSDGTEDISTLIAELTFVNATTGQETPFLFNKDWPTSHPCAETGGQFGRRFFECSQRFSIPDNLFNVSTIPIEHKLQFISN